MTRLRIEALHLLGRGPIDLVVAAGECVAVSGPSGCGKTMLLRTIADLERHEGRVFLDGVECGSLPAPEWRRQVGLLPAESSWWHKTVGDHLAFVDPAWIERLGFTPEVLDWSVTRLSTGERQRLALLRLLVNRPKALLLDEPTANLDAVNAARVGSLIADYRRASDAAVLWVIHDRAQAREVASRVVRIVDGRLTEESEE